MTTENSKLQRRVNDMERKPLQAVSSVQQLQAKVSFMMLERDALATKCGKLDQEMQ